MALPRIWSHAKGVLELNRPILMGILNVTPDSFSDGGQFNSVPEAVEHARQLASLGADIIDVGGESTRPQGARQIGVEEELNRVVPVIRVLAEELPGTLISVDTNKSVVAMAALRAGAAIVNDVSGFRLDARMADVCAAGNAGVVLMHSRGGVADMASYTLAEYRSVVDEVRRELEERVAVARKAGIRSERIALDPGIGFAKRGPHSLAILSRLGELSALGFPVMVGVSRKRFIAELTDEPVPANRVAGTVAANVTALERGARIFRVHDVRPNRQALDVAWAIIERTPDIVMSLIEQLRLIDLGWRDAVEIAIASYAIYRVLLLLHRRRAMQILIGVIILAVSYALGVVLKLSMITYLLSQIFQYAAFALLIVFAPELRAALAQIGRSPMSKFLRRVDPGTIVDEIADAAERLSRNGVGAIIAIEGEVSLQEFIATGSPMQARVSADLVMTIFTPYSPLHDGAVIIRGDTIVGAGCILPLSEGSMLDRDLGTRHRAALGLTEETDAVVVVVSEETSTMSAAVGAKLWRNITVSQLRDVLAGGEPHAVSEERAVTRA